MQNFNKNKTKETIGSVLSICKVSKYLSSGQLYELESLKCYRREHDALTYDDGDNWWQ